jgi:uncharacterized membrane protein YciS (DUF1049 family)
MVKNAIKYFVLAYAIFIVLVPIVLNIQNEENITFNIFLFSVSLGAILVVGIFLGLIISAIIQKPAKEKLFHIFGQIFSFIIF